MTEFEPAPRPYRPCRSCGATKVVRELVPAGEKGMELVIVTCASCGVLRGRWRRKAAVDPS